MTTTESVASRRPTSARPRLSVAAPQQHLQPSLDDVMEEEVDKTDVILSSDVTASVAIADDSPVGIARLQRRRHRLRRRPGVSRHEAVGKPRAKHHYDNRLRNDIVQLVAGAGDCVVKDADASAADDRKSFAAFTTNAFKSSSESWGEATSHETENTNRDKLHIKQLARRQKTTKKDTGAHPKTKDSENEVHSVLDIASGKQLGTDAGRIASKPTAHLKHSKIRAAKRSGKPATSTHQLNRDYQLEMDNPEIKNWLRRKNRMLRKQRAEERRKDRQEKLAEKQQKKVTETRKAESAKKVHAWMKEKLLQQRLDADMSSVTQAEKISAVIHKTFALESPDRLITVELTPKGLPTETAALELHSKKEDHTTTTNVVGLPRNQSRVKAAMSSAPIVYSRLPRTSVTSTQNRRPPTKISLPQSDMQPQASVDNVPYEPGRLSFENWLATKRRQDVDARRETEQVSSRFDEEENNVIRQVARPRIETIFDGRRRVDSGQGNSDRETFVEYPRVAVATTTNNNHGDSSRDQPNAGAQRHRAIYGGDGGSQNEGEGRAPNAANSSRHSHTARRPMQSVNLSDNLVRRSTIALGRPSTAFPARRCVSPTRIRNPISRVEATPRTTGDVSCGDADSARPTLITGNSFAVKKLQAYPVLKQNPKSSKAYQLVKYQQRSWDEFSDHMWVDLNKSEGEEVVPADRPEPVDSENPQVVDDNTPTRHSCDHVALPLSSSNDDRHENNCTVQSTQQMSGVADGNEQLDTTTEIENNVIKGTVTVADVSKQEAASGESNTLSKDMACLHVPASGPPGESDENGWNGSQFSGDNGEEVKNDKNHNSAGVSSVQFGVIPRIIINDVNDDDDGDSVTENLVNGEPHSLDATL